MKRNILSFILGAVITAIGFVSYNQINQYLYDTAVPQTIYGYQLGDIVNKVNEAINDNGAISQRHSSIEDRWDFKGPFDFDGNKWDYVKVYYTAGKVWRIDFEMLCANQKATDDMFRNLQKKYLRTVNGNSKIETVGRRYNHMKDVFTIEKRGFYNTISFIRPADGQ